jgi:hypothetical protein
MRLVPPLVHHALLQPLNVSHSARLLSLNLKLNQCRYQVAHLCFTMALELSPNDAGLLVRQAAARSQLAVGAWLLDGGGGACAACSLSVLVCSLRGVGLSDADAPRALRWGCPHLPQNLDSVGHRQ